MANWYQVQKAADLKQKMKQVVRPALLMAPLGLGLGFMGDDAPAPKPPSAPTVQKVPTTEPSTQPSTQPTTKPTSQPTAPPTTKPVEESGDIDVKKIIQMESSGRSTAVSPVGAAGLMQVMPATWEDIASKIGKYQGFEKYKFDEKANITIGSYYMNTEIPRMLKAFGLPDTVDMRLASYNWGIGNVKKTYEKHGESWRSQLPKETSDYLKKYRR